MQERESTDSETGKFCYRVYDPVSEQLHRLTDTDFSQRSWRMLMRQCLIGQQTLDWNKEIMLTPHRVPKFVALLARGAYEALPVTSDPLICTIRQLQLLKKKHCSSITLMLQLQGQTNIVYVYKYIYKGPIYHSICLYIYVYVGT